MQAPPPEGEDNVEKDQIIMVYGTLSDYDYFIKMMREYKNKQENMDEEEEQELLGEGQEVEMQEMENAGNEAQE